MDDHTHSTPPKSIEYQKLTVTQTPFSNIGLAFSGGGFRAASFTLGTMSYLKNINWGEQTLLDNVSYISSASGGTITNAVYALSLVQEISFDVFYKNLYENIEDIKLLEKVFTNLNDPNVWRVCPLKRRNMINAFALTYNQVLFNGNTVADLKPTNKRLHIDEVCFNTTEFYTGLLFRQAIKLNNDTKQAPTFLYGNYIIHLLNNAQSSLKLADLLAASSCFPAGFEPLLFPDEFIYNDTDGEIKRNLLKNLCITPQQINCDELNLLYKKEDVKKLLEKTPHPIDVPKFSEDLKKLPLRDDLKIGFMDGGITDNQGIESIMRANDRRVKGDTDFKQFDLMLICDVGSHYMDPYKPVDAKTYKGIMGLSINWIMAISAIVFLLIGILVFITPRIISIFLTIVPILCAFIICSILYLKKFIADKTKSGKGLDLSKNFSPEIVHLFFHHFGKTPVGAIADMIRERFNSVIILNSDVFLKRVRQLLYTQFLDEGHATYRMKTNHVYDLCYSNDLNRLQGNDPVSLTPSAPLQVVSQYAFEMATTLWFEKNKTQNKSLPALIACGQFTTCYNLLVYIYHLKNDDPNYFPGLAPAEQQKINQLETVLNVDYAKFMTDPFWLYNQLGFQYNINQFKRSSIRDYDVPVEGFKYLRN